MNKRFGLQEVGHNLHLIEQIVLYVAGNQACPLVNTLPETTRLLQLGNQLVPPSLQLVPLLHTVPLHVVEAPLQGHQSVHQTHDQADDLLNLLTKMMSQCRVKPQLTSI